MLDRGRQENRVGHPIGQEAKLCGGRSFFPQQGQKRRMKAGAESGAETGATPTKLLDKVRARVTAGLKWAPDTSANRVTSTTNPAPSPDCRPTRRARHSPLPDARP